jgi:hypothetical protein
MSRLKITLSLLLAPALLLNANGEGEVSLDPNAPPLGQYELKAKSSFQLNDETRPPFWPIGWVKRVRNAAQSAAVPEVRQELTAEAFSVTSVLLGNPSLAVINGRAYGEGETVRMPRAAAEKGAPTKGRGPRVRVKRILDGRVLLESSDGQTVEVAIRRGKLTEPKAGNPLLNDEEEE